MDDFAAALRSRRSALEAAETLTIESFTLDPDRLASQAWRLIADLPITGNVARIVAATKTLHHLLPELIPPMDRRWTGAFFMWSTAEPQNRQYQTFWLTYRDMVKLARRARPSQYVGDGWKACTTKVLDNAIVGYGRRHNLGP
jgi:hypothetical protein